MLVNCFTNSDKVKKKFIITTFHQRNLENPPAGSIFLFIFLGPLFYIDYEFGEDIYVMSSYEMEEPQIMFSFEI